MLVHTTISLNILLSSSLAANQPQKAASCFEFDEKKLRCLDADGKEGLNPFDASVLFKGISPDGREKHWPKRNAQCIDFSNVKFHNYLGSEYSVLDGWDFRGSKFTNAELYFNFIEAGLFAGSTIEELSIGYGRVTAKDMTFDNGDMPLPQPKTPKEI